MGLYLDVVFDCCQRVVCLMVAVTFKVRTGECHRTLRGHEKGINTIQFDETKVITGANDRTIRVRCYGVHGCVTFGHFPLL